jgi:hypothetical protein
LSCSFVIADKIIYALVSLAIEGKTLQEVGEQKENWENDIDEEDYSSLMIMSILIDPEDLKPDNIIVSPDRKHLTLIDNDHAFVVRDTFVSCFSFPLLLFLNATLQRLLKHWKNMRQRRQQIKSGGKRKKKLN